MLNKNSRTLVLSLSIFYCFTSIPAQADLFDIAKGAIDKTRDTAKAIKDTISDGKSAKREVEDLRQTIVYSDSYVPTREELRRLQMSLNRLGYSTGTPDGLMGERTRTALRQYQARVGIAQTGNMSYELVQEIVVAGNQAPTVTAPVVTASVELSRNEWVNFQSFLNALGYNVGVPDGIPGRKTKAAVNQFMRDRGMTYQPGFERTGYELAAGLVNQPVRSDTSVANSGVNVDGSAPVVTNEFTESTSTPAESLFRLNRHGGDSNTRSTEVIALRMVETEPAILDNKETLNRWFELEGRSVDSSYFLDDALTSFRAELIQRATDRSADNSRVVFAMTIGVGLTKGAFDKATGRFPVELQYGQFTAHPDQFQSSQVLFDLEKHLPYEKKLDGSYKNAIAIPMTLDEAIAFESQYFTQEKNDGRLSMVLDIHFSIDEFQLKDRGQGYGVQADAKTRLLSLTLHERDYKSATDNIGKLIHRWPLNTSMAELPAQDNSLQGIAARFGMNLVDDHLDIDSGNAVAFSAALLLGTDPENLSRYPLSLHIARALLSSAEQRRLFGGRPNSVREEQAKLAHNKIQTEYREQLLSMAIPGNVPVIIQHEVSTGPGAGDSQVTLKPARRLHNGVTAHSASGPLEIKLNTGSRWLPEAIDRTAPQAQQLADYIASQGTGWVNARLNMARYGLLKSGKPVEVNASRYGPGIRQKVMLQVEISREVLHSKRPRNVLYQFPEIHPKQQQFDALVSVLNVPLLNTATLLDRLKSNADAMQYRQKMIEGLGKRSDTNEFNRDEHTKQAEQLFEQQVQPESVPLWVAGDIVLGQYDLSNNQFAIESLSIATQRESAGGGYFSGSVEYEFSEYPYLPVERSVAEQMVTKYPQRKFRFAARVEPLAAVSTSRSETHPRLKVNFKLLELHAISGEPNDDRQSRQLIGSFKGSSEPLASSNEAEPITLDLGEVASLSPELLTLMGAQTLDLSDAQLLNGLLLERWYQETRTDNSIGVQFFDVGADMPNRLSAQISGKPFEAWISSLQIPELQDVKLLLQLSRFPSNNPEKCIGAVSFTNSRGGVSSANPENAERLRQLQIRMDRLKAGERLIEKAINPGFAYSTAGNCRHGSRGQQKLDEIQPLVAPNYSVLFDQLPLVSPRSAEAMLITAQVTGIDFTENPGALPDVKVALQFKQAELLDAFSMDASVVEKITAVELIEQLKLSAPAELAATDVVGITPGMPVSEATKLATDHLSEARQVMIRREFSTSPKPFQQADIWIDESTDEYIALLHEGEIESAVVLGVMRGLRLPGVPFDRDSAINSLREKYGKEQVVKADTQLTMSWGAYVDEWPANARAEARVKGMAGNGGPCRVLWGQSGLPKQLKDVEGNSFKWKDVLPSVRERAFVSWPGVRYELNVLDECRTSIEAFHSVTADTPVVFVGVLDLPGYQKAFSSAVENMAVAVSKPEEKPKAKVKF